MNKIRVGVIGSEGMRGKGLVSLFTRPNEGVHVVARVDQLHSGTIDELVSLSDIDVVVIATPDHLHEEHACAALRAGKHVYLEKPMAITPEQCDHIMTVAKESDHILYVGHNLRHLTVIRKLKECIDKGLVGAVKAVWCRHPVSYGERAYFRKDRWHKQRSNTGSLLIHKGSHDIDIIHWLAGGRTELVTAMGTLAVFGDSNIEDLSSVLMRLNNGVQATYSQCHFAHLACREYMIVGDKGTIVNIGDDPGNAVVKVYNDRNNYGTIPSLEFRFEAEPGFHGDADKRIIDEFIGIVRGSIQPSISTQDAAWAVKTAYAATQSLRSGSAPYKVL